ncbi:hypothetical protein [Lysinibacillus parviboronicapiens]|uniref:hypothetical protein n=1 Tax=Lysinibacillus parviboronicapiens TaxID=436516 RepID=UPI000D35141D|nr:hypothetical protein [Lysinibacillus parviboronicapiens]
MKKTLVGIFIAGILGIGSYFLFGQSGSDEKLTYEGENENWKVEYTLNNIGKEEVQRSINLKYQGSDLSSIGEFQFAVQTKLGKWGQSTIELDENGLYTSSSSVIRKGTLTEKDKPVFTISWNDNEEEIILESK